MYEIQQNGWTLPVIFYEALKKCVSVFFNVLNFLLAGNLPPFGSAGVVVEKDGRYLVIQQLKGDFAFPGGFMRWREHPAQTVRRECKEETGLEVRVGNVIGYYSITSHRIDRMSTLNVIFTGEVVGGQLRESIEGRPCWMREEDLRGKLTTLHKAVLADYLRYRSQDHAMDVRQL
ncbi:MAG TPA: NUDIX domain-containing protein [Ktedonobacteraceae bacterium]|jgi:ADP-ribose pyrophosphatase YjhB (NUDIX family)|nr:NUDIX domain-containing protein [Ktedonobacteraceae bacterium]